jgi:hypothetical protein
VTDTLCGAVGKDSDDPNCNINVSINVNSDRGILLGDTDPEYKNWYRTKKDTATWERVLTLSGVAIDGVALAWPCHSFQVGQVYF